MHPRSKHTGRYDFPRLIADFPDLAPFVSDTGPSKEATIDFADPAAVKALNRALLKSVYGLAHWDVPEGYLCPPIPGRADYIHYLADLLAESNGGTPPPAASVRILDVGVGANCIYPILGCCVYGWRFVAGDVDEAALDAAWKTVEANPQLARNVSLRQQASPQNVLKGLIRPEERFDATLCNPPFNASPDEAQAAARRKWKNLGRGEDAIKNFGGQGGELWYPGGEAAFARRMIEESASFASQVLWFTTLVSKSANLPGLRSALTRARALEAREIEMTQGQKTSRIVAWTFLDERKRGEWRRKRWGGAKA